MCLSSFLKIKCIQMQTQELFQHIMYNMSFLEVSILQKYSTNKYIGQTPGYRDSKKLCIITNGQGDTA